MTLVVDSIGVLLGRSLLADYYRLPMSCYRGRKL